MEASACDEVVEQRPDCGNEATFLGAKQDADDPDDREDLAFSDGTASSFVHQQKICPDLGGEHDGRSLAKINLAAEPCEPISVAHAVGVYPLRGTK